MRVLLRPKHYIVSDLHEERVCAGRSDALVRVAGVGFGPRRSHHARAVVTGAGSGIGRAFAVELARRGGRVVCADVIADRAAETVSQIAASGGAALVVECDVSELDAVTGLAHRAETWFDGPATMVVNNAGVGVGGQAVGDIPIEDWHWALGVNLWGPIHGCHVFVPRLRAAGEGSLINIASAASFAAAPGMGPYSVSKAAVLSLTETVAAELAGTGIAVTAVCPTFVKTNIARDGRIEERAGNGAEWIMRWTGWSPERVVRAALAANDRGQLYVVPQPDAQLMWHAKRHAPATYTRAMGMASRFTTRPGTTEVAPDNTTSAAPS